MSEHGDQSNSPTLQEHIVACLKAIEEYRGQAITKWEAIAQISTAIQSTTAITDIKHRSTTRVTYLTMLNKHNWLLSKASSWGNHTSRWDHDNENDNNIDGEVGSKHAWSQSGTPIFKWPKFDELLYAWKIWEEISPTTLESVNLEHTWKMVQSSTTNHSSPFSQ